MTASAYAYLIDPLIEREGGAKYTNHPSDRGGPTRWGMTEAEARRNGYTGPMQTMPREVAARIYADRYIVKPGLAEIIPLSRRIAEELFDTGVNMGVSWPGIFLQRALNAFNRQGKDYADLKVDGDIGPGTREALKAFLKRRGYIGESVMLKALNCQQGTRYLDITEGRAANEDFTFGWFDHRVALA